MAFIEEDQRHLQAAQGYIELGMYLDANDELEEIPPRQHHQPDVLTVRVGVYNGLKKWELIQTVAGRLVAEDPMNPQWHVSLAHAVRHAQSVEAAKLILLEAVERMPKDPVLQYNLACLRVSARRCGSCEGQTSACIQARFFTKDEGFGG